MLNEKANIGYLISYIWEENDFIVNFKNFSAKIYLENDENLI